MNFRRDLSFAVRTAGQHPVFTAVILATLMLGIGLTTGIFSAFYSVLLKPLPFRDPNRLVLVMEKLPGIPVPINMPPSEALELSVNPAFSESAIFISSARNLQGGNHPERVDVLRASAGLLPLLGVSPSQGRAFTEQEDAHGVGVAMISDSLRKRRFGEEQAVGKTLLVDGTAYQIVGILPQQFAFPTAGMSQNPGNADIWIPLSLTPGERAPGNPDYSFSLLARLRSGFTADQAAAAAHGGIERILSHLPPENRGKFTIQASVLPLQAEVVAGSHRLLVFLLCAAAALLLISCTNVSNMLLSRALARRRELALRVSLGANAKAIVSQLVTETVFIFACGGVLGMTCAIWSQHALIRLLPPDLPRLEDIHINGPVLAFSVAVSLLAGIVFGLVPALSALRTDFVQYLNDGSRSQTAGPGGSKTRRVLVVMQLALTFVLLTGAGLLLRSFSSVLNQQAAFRTDKVISFGVALPKEQYPTASDGDTFYLDLSRRLGALPGVSSVGFGTDIPFENKSGRLISPERATLHASPIVDNTDVAGYYFQSLGLRLLRGKFLTAHDNKDSEPVAVVNQSFAKTFWSAGDPLDYRFKFGPQTAQGPWVRIVGVVADSGARSPDKPSDPRVYIPLDQDPYKAVAFREAWFVLRTQGSGLALGPSIQTLVHSLDASMPVVRFRSMDQVVANAIAPRSANTWLITVFSLAALLLSCLGTYGVVAQSVSQRIREIGIRIALGATRRDISTIVLGEGGRLAMLALAIGLPASFAASTVIRTLLFGVPPDDSTTRVLVMAAILVSVLMSLVVPLWRAVHVDPQAALRES